MSSPSVIFTDEQALIGDKGTLYSSASDETASSIADEILDSSQPESQVKDGYHTHVQYMYVTRVNGSLSIIILKNPISIQNNALLMPIG